MFNKLQILHALNITTFYRPFIIIYQDQTELEEIGVFNLSSARVDYKSDLEEMLQVRLQNHNDGSKFILHLNWVLISCIYKQRKYTFAIYTHNNAYLLQANDFEDMKDWISKIDQFYPVKKLENLV